MKLNLNQLNKRQEIILNFIDQQEKSSISELVLHLKNKVIKISKITIIRDLNQLIKLGFIKKMDRDEGFTMQSLNNIILLSRLMLKNILKLNLTKDMAK
ncbi:MAG: DeoR family transcriptional regulator, partial [Patescibacteria group bacterium]